MELDGWKIPEELTRKGADPTNLSARSSYDEDLRLWELPHLGMAVVCYHVVEASMGAEYGNIAVLENKSAPVVRFRPRHLRCFLSGKFGGVQTVETPEGVLAVVNGGFYYQRPEEPGENPFFFLRLPSLSVAVARFQNAHSYRIRTASHGSVEFIHQATRSGEGQRPDVHLDLTRLQWRSIDIFDWRDEELKEWFFSLPPARDR